MADPNSVPRDLESAGENPSLVEWLTAQLDEDEQAASRLQARAQKTRLQLQGPEFLGRVMPGWGDWPQVEAMCTMRLAEIAAKRAVLDFYSSVAQEFERIDVILGEAQRTGSPRGPEDMRNYARFRGELGTLGDVPTILAQPYRDRPGFREEWAL